MGAKYSVSNGQNNVETLQVAPMNYNIFNFMFLFFLFERIQFMEAKYSVTE